MSDKERGEKSLNKSDSYLPKGSLSQNLEQFKLRGVSLFWALFDHMGDVDLLDVSIFLQSKKYNTQLSNQNVNNNNNKTYTALLWFCDGW